MFIPNLSSLLLNLPCLLPSRYNRIIHQEGRPKRPLRNLQRETAAHPIGGSSTKTMETDARFPTKLNAISDAPEPLRSALVESFPSEKSLRLLVHAPAFSTVGKKNASDKLVGFTDVLAPVSFALAIRSHWQTASSIAMGASWDDDTKVRTLSGSRSCGDARALSNSSSNTIFKVPGGGEGDSVQKISVSRSKSDNRGHAFHLGTTPDALRGVFQPLNRREFTLNALNCPIWVLSNRTILTLSSRHPNSGHSRFSTWRRTFLATPATSAKVTPRPIPIIISMSVTVTRMLMILSADIPPIVAHKLLLHDSLAEQTQMWSADAGGRPDPF